MSYESTYAKVFGRLQGVRRSGRGWRALCPIHEADGGRHKPSLNINIGRSGDLVLWCPVCCCPFDDLVQSLDLNHHDFFVDQEPPPMSTATANEIVTAYDYREANGTLLYQVVRYQDKTFRPRRKHPDDGSWIWGLNKNNYVKGRNGDWYAARPEADASSLVEFPECRRVLYKLPELMAADPKRLIFIVEGERDVDRLAALGILATCNPGGAGTTKWHPSYTEALRNRPVAVVPDNDPVDDKLKFSPGVEHAKNICNQLLGVASSVKYLPLPGVPEKGDISDYFNGGATKEDLQQLVKNCAVLTEKFTLVSDRNREQAPRTTGNGCQSPNGQATNGHAKAEPSAPEAGLASVQEITAAAKALGPEKMLVVIQFLCSELAVSVADQGGAK